MLFRSPAHLRYHLKFLTFDELIFDNSAKASNIFLQLETTLQKYADIADAERKFIMLEAEERFRQKFHKDGNRFSQLDETVQLGDIVLVKEPNLREDALLGRVTGLDSPTTVTVQTSKGEIKRQSATIHPLYYLRRMKEDAN